MTDQQNWEEITKDRTLWINAVLKTWSVTMRHLDSVTNREASMITSKLEAERSKKFWRMTKVFYTNERKLK